MTKLILYGSSGPVITGSLRPCKPQPLLLPVTIPFFTEAGRLYAASMYVVENACRVFFAAVSVFGTTSSMDRLKDMNTYARPEVTGTLSEIYLVNAFNHV